METKITVRIVEDDGHFVAKAVGYPGVVTFGKSKKEAIDGIQEAWNAMAQYNAIKSNSSAHYPGHGKSTETNYQLQFA